MSGALKLKFSKRDQAGTGANSEPAAIAMERRIVALRWLAMLLATGTLPFLHLGGQTILLMSLIGLGAVYNLALQFVVVRLKPGWITAGYFTTIGDILLATGGVAVSGGIHSPFFLAYFWGAVIAAVRFGGLAAITAVVTIAISYSAVVYYVASLNGTQLGGSDLTDLALRTGFVALTGMTVGLLGYRARNEEHALPAGLWFRVPVFHGARAIADMLVGFQGRALPLRDTERELMLTFAERAGIAMRNAHNLDQAQKLSVTDAVTGLPNHRYFHTRLDEELEKCKATGGSITVMMVDLDRFKVYNDSFGHAAGDVALKAAARTISSTMRREDVVTRYGGEEFVAILPGVDIQTAPIRAQEICDTLAKVFMYNPKTIFAPLTASVGWATYPVDARNRDELLNRADLAMYMAKKRGRNCICGASELESVAALDSVLSEVVAQLASADTVGPGMVATLEKRLGQIANSSHLEELAEGMLSPNSEATLEALNALAASIDAKDPYTSGHSQSVAKLAEDLGDMLQLSGAHKNQLRLAAILHDVGKIGVVDKVLLKEGKLDEDEKLIMRMHPILGARILQPIKAFRQTPNVVLHHPESYDGSGYPDGLAGQNIPLHARIVSVCDAYHAMTSTRPYRQRRTPEFALAQLEAGKGTQFDPIIVDYFIQMMRKRQAENPDALEADVHDDHPSAPEAAAAS